MKEVRQWSVQVEDDMQDATSDVNMFRSSSSDVSEFTGMVTSFIATLEDTIIPKVKASSSTGQTDPQTMLSPR